MRKLTPDVYTEIALSMVQIANAPDWVKALWVEQELKARGLWRDDVFELVRPFLVSGNRPPESESETQKKAAAAPAKRPVASPPKKPQTIEYLVTPEAPGPPQAAVVESEREQSVPPVSADAAARPETTMFPAETHHVEVSLPPEAAANVAPPVEAEAAGGGDDIEDTLAVASLMHMLSVAAKLADGADLPEAEQPELPAMEAAEEPSAGEIYEEDALTDATGAEPGLWPGVAEYGEYDWQQEVERREEPEADAPVFIEWVAEQEVEQSASHVLPVASQEEPSPAPVEPEMPVDAAPSVEATALLAATATPDVAGITATRPETATVKSRKQPGAMRKAQRKPGTSAMRATRAEKAPPGTLERARAAASPRARKARIYVPAAETPAVAKAPGKPVKKARAPEKPAAPKRRAAAEARMLASPGKAALRKKAAVSSRSVASRRPAKEAPAKAAAKKRPQREPVSRTAAPKAARRRVSMPGPKDTRRKPASKKLRARRQPATAVRPSARPARKAKSRTSGPSEELLAFATMPLEARSPGWEFSVSALDEAHEAAKGTQYEHIWERAAGWAEDIRGRVDKRRA